MNKVELIEMIRSGEDSTLEFKRDDVPNHDLAKALTAFLNLEGGTVLLGVDDDGSIAGTARDRLDEWVSELCRTKIEPPVILLRQTRDRQSRAAPQHRDAGGDEDGVAVCAQPDAGQHHA